MDPLNPVSNSPRKSSLKATREKKSDTYLREPLATSLIVALVWLKVVMDSLVLFEGRFMRKALFAQFAIQIMVTATIINRPIKWQNRSKSILGLFVFRQRFLPFVFQGIIVSANVFTQGFLIGESFVAAVFGALVKHFQC